MDVIEEHISTSEGKLNSLIAPSLQKFWTTEQISEMEFMEKADTFDLVLFQGNAIGSYA